MTKPLPKPPNRNGKRHNNTTEAKLPDGVLRLLMNASTSLISRGDLIRTLSDPRRDIYDECGYPKGPIPIASYQEMYDRESIAGRVVECLPKECFRVTPEVYESEDENTVTPFEEYFNNLGKQLCTERSWHSGSEGSTFWEAVLKLDILSGIGEYGVMLLSIDDGLPLDQPAKLKYADYKVAGLSTVVVPQSTTNATVATEPDEQLEPKEEEEQEGEEDYSEFEEEQEEEDGEGKQPPFVEPTRRLLGVEVFPQAKAQITSWETNRSSPRYMKPIKYLITFHSQDATSSNASSPPMSSREVHWTRIIHVADNVESNKVYGNSRMKQVFNNLIAIQKIYGGDGEGFWKSVINTTFFETLPQLGPDPEIDEDSIRDMMEQIQNGLQKHGILKGLTAKSVPPSLLDPTPHIAAHTKAICIKLAIPVPVFEGYEIGEQASTNNDSDWTKRVAHRENFYLTPNVIVPIIDRLIDLDVLPEPKEYFVYWPDLFSETDESKTALATQKVQAIATYISSGADALIPPIYFFTMVMGWDREEVEMMLEEASAIAEGEGGASDMGSSPLLSTAGGITAITELFGKFKEGALSRESLKQLLIMLLNVDDIRAEEIIADTIGAEGVPAGAAPTAAPSTAAPTF